MKRKSVFYYIGYTLSFLMMTANFAHGQTVTIPSNNLSLGKTGASNKIIEFNLTKSGASSNPKIRWNNSTNKLQFSNNGTSFFDYQTGSANITSDTAGSIKHEHFSCGGSGGSISAPTVCNTAICTVYTTSITGLTITRSSTGSYVVNHGAGWVTKPSCSYGITTWAGATAGCNCQRTSSTSTTFNLLCVCGSSVQDVALDFTCSGPR